MKEERQKKIIELLSVSSAMTTDMLADKLSASKETIRRDLKELQLQGKLLRNHGHAKYIRGEEKNNADPFLVRIKRHALVKTSLAELVFPWIDEGMVIALDASSTSWFVARAMPDIDLTVFTNSHAICVELGKRDNIRLISSGGELQRQYGCYDIIVLLSHLKKIEIDLAIFSCEGIDATGVLWDSSPFNADFKKAIIKNSGIKLLLADKSKFNRSSEIVIGSLDDITQVLSQ